MDKPRHLWDYTWARDLVILLLVVVLVYLAYRIRSVTVPVLLGLALAYVFNPLVTWAHARWRLSRLTSTVLVMLAAGVAALLAALIVLPLVYYQLANLVNRIAEYAQYITTRISPYIDRLNERARDTLAQDDETLSQQLLDWLAQVDMAQIKALMIRSLNLAFAAVGVVGSAINLAAYVMISLIILVFCFFYFSWRFDRIIAWFEQWIPPANKQRTVEIIARMDRTIAAFIRGRLIQALVMGCVLSIGWYFADVRYWLLLGLLSGLLNLVPFMAVLGWVAAVSLALVDHLAGGGTFSIWVVAWPTLVYVAAQALDGWVVEPVVQGKATDLDPLMVLLAVFAGGALAGLLGLLLAIPVAACVKILCQEVVFPQLRAYVHRDEPAP